MGDDPRWARLAIAAALLAGCKENAPNERAAEEKAAPQAAAALTPFYCFAVGTVVGRECLKTKERCEELRDKHEGCVPFEHAHCFSKLSIEGGGKRDMQCTPTAEECRKWSAAMDKAGRETGPCILSTHAEVWP
jgi:hypothetical protein